MAWRSVSQSKTQFLIIFRLHQHKAQSTPETIRSQVWVLSWSILAVLQQNYQPLQLLRCSNTCKSHFSSTVEEESDCLNAAFPIAFALWFSQWQSTSLGKHHADTCPLFRASGARNADASPSRELHEAHFHLDEAKSWWWAAMWHSWKLLNNTDKVCMGFWDTPQMAPNILGPLLWSLSDLCHFYTTNVFSELLTSIQSSYKV